MPVPSSPDERGRHVWLMIGAFLGVCAGLVAIASFETMLVPLQRQFVFSVDIVNILPLAVSTGSLAILFISGSLVDRWGARRVVTLGACALVTGAVVIMAAAGIGWLLVGRIIGGVGGMSMSIAALAVLNATFKNDKQRAHVFGVLAAALGATSLISPLLGGFIVQRVSWRAVPMLWIAVAVLAVVILRRVVREQSAWAGTREVVTPLLAGLAMSSLCLGALLVGLSAPWAVAAIGMAVVWAVILAGRWIHLRHRGRQPGLNVSIFRSRGSLLLMAALICVTAVNLSFYVSLFLQYRLGLNPAEAAAALIIPQCGAILGGLIGGSLAGRLGSLRTTAFALAFGTVAALCLLMINESSRVPLVIVLVTAFALPAGCLVGTLTNSFLDLADPAASGAASSWRQGAWSLGATIGGIVTGALAFGYFSRNWQAALEQAGINENAARQAAAAVRGGMPLAQLTSIPGLESLDIASNARTLLGLSTSQIASFRMIALLAAASYIISLLLVVTAMWRTHGQGGGLATTDH